MGGLTMSSFFSLVHQGVVTSLRFFIRVSSLFANPGPFVITNWFSLLWQIETGARVTKQIIVHQDLVHISHLIYEEEVFAIHKDIYGS